MSSSSLTLPTSGIVLCRNCLLSGGQLIFGGDGWHADCTCARMASTTTKSKSKSGGATSGTTSANSNVTTDHNEIRQWAEERGAQPACVKGTGRKAGDIGMIRLDFPGYSGEESLEPIKAFDDNGLALVYQEETASGQKSNFNKLVKREEE